LTLGAEEFEEWKLHMAERPFGAYRDNIHAAMIVATLRNIHRGQGAELVKFSDFMLATPEEHRSANMGEAIDKLKAMAFKSKKEAKRDRSGKSSRKARSPNGPVQL